MKRKCNFIQISKKLLLHKNINIILNYYFKNKIQKKIPYKLFPSLNIKLKVNLLHLNM